MSFTYQQLVGGLLYLSPTQYDGLTTYEKSVFVGTIAAGPLSPTELERSNLSYISPVVSPQLALPSMSLELSPEVNLLPKDFGFQLPVGAAVSTILLVGVGYLALRYMK